MSVLCIQQNRKTLQSTLCFFRKKTDRLQDVFVSLPTQSLAENEHSAQATCLGIVLSESLHSLVMELKANP